MTKEERLKKIRELIEASGEISLQDLQRIFSGKSMMTLRRDLSIVRKCHPLEQQ